jgi:2-dehydro-3-deoxyglucarate aldolase/4-hydroxy-2-oxoheptanedioate aldolase
MARTLRDLCTDRSFKFGHFVVEFATPGIGHILKGAGCEFVLFDTGHSGSSTDVVRSCVRYFEAAQLPAICRVPSQMLGPPGAL